MPLSNNENEWLTDFFDRVEEGSLPEWEANFVADQKKRYGQYGADIFLSFKQYSVLFRIAVNKLDMELPPGHEAGAYADRR